MEATHDVLTTALLVALLIIDRLTRQQGALAVAVKTTSATARDFALSYGTTMDVLTVA